MIFTIQLVVLLTLIFVVCLILLLDRAAYKRSVEKYIYIHYNYVPPILVDTVRFVEHHPPQQ